MKLYLILRSDVDGYDEDEVKMAPTHVVLKSMGEDEIADSLNEHFTEDNTEGSEERQKLYKEVCATFEEDTSLDELEDVTDTLDKLLQ